MPARRSIALAWAAYWRYLQALGSPMTAEEFAAAVPGGLQYRGEYLVPVGEALAARTRRRARRRRISASPTRRSGSTPCARPRIAMMLAEIREDLALLGVRQDVFTSRTRYCWRAGAVDASSTQLRRATG